MNTSTEPVRPVEAGDRVTWRNRDSVRVGTIESIDVDHALVIVEDAHPLGTWVALDRLAPVAPTGSLVSYGVTIEIDGVVIGADLAEQIRDALDAAVINVVTDHVPPPDSGSFSTRVELRDLETV